MCTFDRSLILEIRLQSRCETGDQRFETSREKSVVEFRVEFPNKYYDEMIDLTDEGGHI